ncbi:hypothetical protein P691DRAFT_781763 [Macrolepiota fuliginosa MF-IS2]|uniref:Uncharacterized protein n=1 Tax=Macrolepiota fuliginosa MF-IS2 TaxID=1400762 RepID=A0A9P5XAN3_9AGAR|nr:hypothetical protein P691DRAFT_781763 [Macrolepiota fuliginosa MF-IS2]
MSMKWSMRKVPSQFMPLWNIRFNVSMELGKVSRRILSGGRLTGWDLSRRLILWRCYPMSLTTGKDTTGFVVVGCRRKVVIYAWKDGDAREAKAIALYPKTASGRLAVSQREWIQLLGGPAAPLDNSSLTAGTGSSGHERLCYCVQGLSLLNTRRLPHRLRTKLGLVFAAVSVTLHEQLLRFPQVIDAVLYKAHIGISPGLFLWEYISRKAPSYQVVTNYLKSIDPKICIKYLKFIIEGRHEEYHDRITLSVKRRNETHGGVDAKLLKFLNTNDKTRVDRLHSILSPTDAKVRATDGQIAIRESGTVLVHVPRCRGEVTHYQRWKALPRKLNDPMA